MRPALVDYVVERVLAELRPRVREVLAEALRSPSAEMVNQKTSEHGSRRTIKAWLHAEARGVDGIYRTGRLYWISRDALAAELELMSRERSNLVARAERVIAGPGADLRRELGLVRGGRR
jgi:hypothetical protein